MLLGIRFSSLRRKVTRNLVVKRGLNLTEDRFIEFRFQAEVEGVEVPTMRDFSREPKGDQAGNLVKADDPTPEATEAEGDSEVGGRLRRFHSA